MSLAIFDLDNTLLGGDSDARWGEFLVANGLVDGDHYAAENQRYYEEYKAGTLDIYEFLNFSLKPLSEHEMDQLQEWREQFIKDKILDIVLPEAQALVDSHRDSGCDLLIITATNRFITEPIADLFGIEHLLATEPEIVNNRYTGKVAGVPCFQEGKVTRLHEWLQTHQKSLDDSWFYSDSHNDLPLLHEVSHPVAVDADPQLTAEAQKLGWSIISLRS